MAKSNEIWLAAYGDYLRPSQRKVEVPEPKNTDPEVPNLQVEESAPLPQETQSNEPPQALLAQALFQNTKKTSVSLNAIGDIFARYLMEVQAYGTNPDVGVYKLIREHRVLAFCQSNAIMNSFREFGARLIPGLARRGVTHLVLEMPKETQDALNYFAQTKDVESLKENLSGYKIQFSEDYLKIIVEAGKKNIQLIALDSNDDQKNDLVQFAFTTIRNLLIQENSRVLFWAGNEYLEKRAGQQSLIELFKASSIKAASINGVSIAAERGSRKYPLTELIPLLDDARFIDTSKTTDIAKCIYNAGPQNQGCVWGDFDYIYIAGRKDILCDRNRKT